MTVKTEKGQMAKQDAMRPYMCEILAKLKGGKEGRDAAAQGMKTQNNVDVTVKDVYVPPARSRARPRAMRWR